MISLKIDNIPVAAADDETVLRAVLDAGIDIPRLCRDGGEESGFKCGLCFVEIDGAIVLACDTKVVEGMSILTDTPAVRQAVRERLEKLLAGHPASCSTCAKGGDCALQRLCAKYRPQITSGATGKKRKLLDWIEADEAKCIGCGRCAAFLKQSGIPLAGKTVPPTVCPVFTLSGTLTDLCPSGALAEAGVSELYRPWEIKKTRTIDVTDAVCAPVNVGTVHHKIVSVVPAQPDGLIADKGRYCLDALRQNRLDRPYIRENGALREASWEEALQAVAAKMKATPAERIAGLAGTGADCESMLALKDLSALLGATAVDARERDDMYFDTDSRQSWLFNTPFDRLNEADALLSVGAGICRRAAAVGWRLRQNDMPKAFIGAPGEADLPYEFFGKTPVALLDALNGTGEVARFLKKAKKPMIVIGSPVLTRPDAPALMETLYKICEKYGVIREDWNGWNYLAEKPSLIGALELGLVAKEPLLPKIKDGAFEFVYLLNADSFVKSPEQKAFVVYQGMFATPAARAADVVLPATAFTEKRATYVNMQGIAESTAVVCPPVGMAREDWKIFRALSEYMGTAPLPYDTLDDVRDGLAGKNMIFYKRGEIQPAENKPFGVAGDVSEAPFDAPEGIFDDEPCRVSAHARMLKQGGE